MIGEKEIEGSSFKLSEHLRWITALTKCCTPFENSLSREELESSTNLFIVDSIRMICLSDAAQVEAMTHHPVDGILFVPINSRQVHQIGSLLKHAVNHHRSSDSRDNDRLCRSGYRAGTRASIEDFTGRGCREFSARRRIRICGPSRSASLDMRNICGPPSCLRH